MALSVITCKKNFCTDDLTVFTTLFQEVCQPFNISVPILGSNSSANGTNVTFTPGGSPSITLYADTANETRLDYTL